MHIAQSSTRLSGVQYGPGDVVPDSEVTQSLIDVGIVITVPDQTVDEIRGDFDPGTHTVAETLGYVERHPDRAGDVYAAEAATEKPRVTILRHLEAEYPDQAAEAGERPPDPQVELDRVRAELAEARAALARRPDAAPESDPEETTGASASLTPPSPPTPGEPAGNATAADLTDGQLDGMREAAGVDPAGEPNPSAPVPPPYDPGAHRPAEVLAYADAHPDDLLDLGKAERAGKNRKGLLEDLGRRLTAPGGPR